MKIYTIVLAGIAAGGLAFLLAGCSTTGLGFDPAKLSCIQGWTLSCGASSYGNQVAFEACMAKAALACVPPPIPVAQ